MVAITVALVAVLYAAVIGYYLSQRKRLRALMLAERTRMPSLASAPWPEPRSVLVLLAHDCEGRALYIPAPFDAFLELHDAQSGRVNAEDREHLLEAFGVDLSFDSWTECIVTAGERALVWGTVTERDGAYVVSSKPPDKLIELIRTPEPWVPPPGRPV